MSATDPLFVYALRLGDDSLILGQRLSAWCGSAPTIEVDLSLANVALDLIGQATHFLEFAANLEGAGHTADTLAFDRDVLDFTNCLLVEQPNGDFAQTIARQVLFSTFQELFLERLSTSKSNQLAAIASKAVKEVAYHSRLARDWTIRLGDGTAESKARMSAGLEWMWRFVDELFEMDAIEAELASKGMAVDKRELRSAWDQRIASLLSEATLPRPRERRPVTGGRKGHHSEHLGHLLSEMQFLPRAYPGASW